MHKLQLHWTAYFTGKRFQMTDSVNAKNRTGTTYPDNRCSPNEKAGFHHLG